MAMPLGGDIDIHRQGRESEGLFSLEEAAIMRSMSRGAWLGGACLAIAGLILAMGVGSALSQPPEDPSFKAETPPPEGQKYIGSKKCSSCHFDQFMTWKKSKHGKEAWETLPAKYRTDAECIKCHATGVGRETGFTSFEETPGLAGGKLRGLPRSG
jgi:hypothetical protein